MNTDLLRSWLTLPPGAWPPDDRTLLGLKPGPLSAVEVEQQALAQMEKLRPHQLVQPELVTEGMNRLAQALITLTEAANRTQLGVPSKSGLPKPDDADIILDASKAPGAVAQPIVLDAEVVSVPKILDAPKAETPRKRPRAPKAKRRKKRRAATGSAVEIPTIEPLPPGTAYSPAERRKGYRELAAMRRVLRAWERLQPYFAVPSEAVETPGAVFGFVDSVRACRRAVAVDGDVEWFEEYGGAVLSVVRHPASLAVFRSLVFEQRQNVAADWAHATALLRGRYRGLREEMQRTKPKKVWGKTAREVGRWFRANPEWLLGALVVLAVTVAFVRSVGRSPG